ncbi:cell division protein FtsQ [Mobilisporobacter senegalensis]|uniref:Cell division protein FtsQ n=1 Tax=Mobilisporobacter senegalensis TaxID=1329262 RepID=A0A3N1XVT5_9FIRM|nr:cell division protein FtsQ/DivIB [Mobilisporobacter senegalensis]ROR30744.1 cell division protein FtsQ [Mobilisporobacter senegalensis]
MIHDVQKKSNYGKKKFKKFLILFIILLIAILILYFGFRITKVNVIGCDYYTEEQIKNKLIVNEFDKNSLFLFLKHKYFDKTEIPFIQKIDIELVNQNTVDINVYEKTMIGCIEYMGQILYFDKDGIIVESSKRKIDYVPYIVGLKYDKLVLNEKIETPNDKLLVTILNITQLIRKYQLPIDKISFSPNNEVTLISSDIRVLLGKHDLYDEQMANLKNILQKSGNLKGVLDMSNFTEENNTFVFKPD